VSPARAAAWRALSRLRGGARLDDALTSLPELDGLSERDRALAYDLIVGTVKRRGTVDAVLTLFTKAPLRSAPAKTRDALRLGAFQLLFLDRVPAHAVVDEAVEMVADQGAATRGFVNAVLRRVSREGHERLAALEAGPDGRAWAVRHSCPRWLVGVLRRDLGDAAAGSFLEAANAAPERCLRVNTLKGDVDLARQALAAAGFGTRRVPGLPEALLYDGPSLERSLPFRDGLVTPQSRGSQIVGLVAALGAEPSVRILDLCAAPGTKTSHLAASVAGARLTAVDVDVGRLAAMGQNLVRLGVDGVEAVRADILELGAACDGAYESAFDVVLLDAPCSGLGTLGSRADLRWRRRWGDVGRLAALQRDLLLTAAGFVRPGGTLTYAVCTVSREETLGVVEALTSRGGWSLDDLGAVWRDMSHPAADRCLLVLPPAHGSSGFFIARVRRDAATRR
jgi:16S rRNA (cytosine967-C5)-methyltransferase